MEDPSRDVELGEPWSDEFAQKLHEQRHRAESLLRAERERFCCARTALDQYVEALAEELRRDREAAQQRAAELDRQGAELDEKAARLVRLEQELDQRKAQWDQLQIEAADHQQALLADLRRQHEKLQQQLEKSETLHNEHEQHRAEWERLRTEHERELARRWAERDPGEQTSGESGSRNGQSMEFEELQRRFEMAVQEVREVKTENAELLEELVALRQSNQAAPAGCTATDGLDWESQKRRILAELDADFDTQHPQQARDRLTVEGAIRITDQVVAEKEQEIRELKELLAEQSGSLGNVAIGAAAIQETLDQDELIREERANLKRLQEECQAKLRQAEIDISLERAKLARERAHIDERTHSYEFELSKSESGDGKLELDKKSSRRGWRARLGLSDEDGK